MKKLKLVFEGSISQRENNYDLLRIISATAVIMIHVSGIWFHDAVNMIAKYGGGGIEEIQTPFMICVYNSISRFAVPCFIMLSGAFIIDNKKNAEYKKFYSKTFARIGVQTIVFSGLYILYRIPLCFTGEDRGVGTLLKDIILGSPMYHMWYLYMLIGIYALVPMVLRFKESVAEKTFYKVSFVFLVWASISQWTTGDIVLRWNIGQSFEYLGYFMVGYSIRKIFKDKNNLKAIFLIGLGILFEMCAAGLGYKYMIDGMDYQDLKSKILFPYCPFIVTASICIFIGFTLLDVKRKWSKLSALTFYIYLIHIGVLDLIQKIFIIAGRKMTMLNGAIWIPIFVTIVFVVSCLLSKLYLWVWTKLDIGRRITNRMLRAVGLRTD